MNETYELCLKLLARGILTAKMLDVFYANQRITEEQYAELLGRLSPAE